MTWATILSTGSGRIVGYRLMIEGVQACWVTHPEITFQTNRDNRTVYNGLLSEGLGFTERLNAQECMTHVTGFTAKIRSTDSADSATGILSRDVSPVAYLNSDLTAAGTTISTSPALSNDTYYHLGSETIKVGTYPTIARQKWHTQAQAHNVTVFGDTNPYPIYAYPPTLEGRRCVLYVYGEGDSLIGDGTVLFRGIVTRPPSLGGDGLTWSIQVGPRHALLAQNVAGSNNQAKLYGIYHHNACPFFIRMNYNGTLGNEYYVTGLHDTMQSLIDDINTELETARAAIPATNISYVRLAQDFDGALRIVIKTAGAASDFILFAGSPLLGYINDTDANWFDAAGNAVNWENIAINTVYSKALEPREFVTTESVGLPSTALGIVPNHPFSMPALANAFSDPSAAEDPWSLYLDKDLGTLTGEYVHISGTNIEDGIFEVALSDTDPYDFGNVYRVDLVPVKAPGHAFFMGFLGSEVTVTHLRDYGTGDVADFITTIVTNAALYANNGDAPFLCDDTNSVGDVTTWTIADTGGFHAALSARRYRFVKSKSLQEVLSEELKLIGHFLYLDSVGRMVIRALPSVTQQMVASTTLDASNIITPPSGAWPGWEAQRDGIVNHVEIQGGYNPVEDEWTGELFQIRALASIAEHKTRGKGKITVKPYSGDFSGIDNTTAIHIAEMLMQFLGRDYAIVTVRVPLTLFSLLIGDVVKLTHRLIPNGSGGRSVTTKRAIVVEKKWKLDPADPEGTLSLYIPRGDDGGYTPTGHITSQTNPSGNNWNITLLHTNAFNQALSQTGSGVVAEHFAASDYIEVVNMGGSGGGEVTGDAGETTVTGTVTSSSGNVVVVALDSTWTPGTDTWWLKWRKDTGATATAHQVAFTYVGDTTLLLTNGNPARRFA